MNLLFRIVYAAHASGTQHATSWRSMRCGIASNARTPTSGSGSFSARRALTVWRAPRRPTREFKDLKNHTCCTRATGLLGRRAR